MVFKMNIEDNNAKIRRLLQEISAIIDNKAKISSYEILTDIVIKMEEKYNLQDEEIIKQLELILKSEEV